MNYDEMSVMLKALADPKRLKSLIYCLVAAYAHAIF